MIPFPPCLIFPLQHINMFKSVFCLVGSLNSLKGGKMQPLFIMAIFFKMDIYKPNHCSLDYVNLINLFQFKDKTFLIQHVQNVVVTDHIFKA